MLSCPAIDQFQRFNQRRELRRENAEIEKSKKSKVH